MDAWKEVNEYMDRINSKLDLLLELVHAKNSGDSERVDEVCMKLDSLKKIPVVG